MASDEHEDEPEVFDPDSTRSRSSEIIKISDHKFKCVYCTNVYAYPTGVFAHLATKHRRTNDVQSFPCEHPGCSRTYSTDRARTIHKNLKHDTRPAKHKCTEKGCSKLFPNPTQRVYHMKNDHTKTGRRQWLCPFCKKESCFDARQRHLKRCRKAQRVSEDERKRRVKEDDQARKPINTEAERKKKEKIAEKERIRTADGLYGCPDSEEYFCSAVLKTFDAAQTHSSQSHRSDWFVCPLPTCKDHQIRTPIHMSSITRHLRSHVSRHESGHIEKKDCERVPAPMRRDALPPPWPKFLREHGFLSKTTEDSVSDTEQLEDIGDCEVNGLDACAAGFLDWESTSVSLEDILKDLNTDLSDEQIVLINLKYLEALPEGSELNRPCFMTTICVGPEPLPDILTMTKPCPRGTEVSLSTARVQKLRGNKHGITWRCDSCLRALRKIWLAEQLYGPIRGQQYCAVICCFEQPVESSTCCSLHRGLKLEHPDVMADLRKALLKKSVELWTLDSNGQIKRLMERLDFLFARPGRSSRVVSLDLEYDCITQVVSEIGVCDFITGETLFEAYTERDTKPPRTGDLVPDLDRVYLTDKNSGYRMSAKARRKMVRRKSPAQIEAGLREFMDTDTLVITWATSASDMKILHGWLQANGVMTEDFLPPLGNCLFSAIISSEIWVKSVERPRRITKRRSGDFLSSLGSSLNYSFRTMSLLTRTIGLFPMPSKLG